MIVKENAQRCIKCNMNYLFKDTIRTSITTIGIYECPTCGDVIKV